MMKRYIIMKRSIFRYFSIKTKKIYRLKNTSLNIFSINTSINVIMKRYINFKTILDFDPRTRAGVYFNFYKYIYTMLVSIRVWFGFIWILSF